MVRHRTLEHLVTEVASELVAVDADTVHAAYTRVLRSIVEYFGVHSSYLRHHDRSNRSSTMIAEWPARPDAPDPDPLGVVFFQDDPVFAMCENLTVPRIFRPQPETEEYRKRVEKASGFKATSMAVVPLVTTEPIGWVGLIQIGDRDWADHEIEALAAISTLLAQVKARITAEESLRAAAVQDTLTGLANRRGLEHDLKRRLDRSDHSRPSTVIYLDLDRLKALNDFYGHTAGDSYLRSLAHTLRAALGPDALIARWGGDEFVVVVDPPASESGTKTQSSLDIARTVLDAVADTTVSASGDMISRTASVGVISASPGVDDVDEVLANADYAALSAKRSGGNCIVMFDAEIRAQNTLHNDVEMHLRDAIRGDELILHYQPEIDLSSGQIVGIEALVRWQHPTRGLLPPSAFVEVAEASDLAGALGRWVLNHAASTYARWVSEMPDLDVVMSVNVSPAQLLEPDFVDVVAETLQSNTLSTSRFRLEITETAAVHDTTRVAYILDTLRSIGVAVAIDDFGTGYSSLAHLKVLPVDAVKIDRQFVQNLGTDEQDRAVVNAVLDLAAAFGLQVVAEGVETREARDALHSMGCTRAQGFLYSKPVPADEMRALLRVGSIHVAAI
ncbi:EAL domain-containing protein [Rhodococcus sp. BS-15]|uniref:bifunctional diguanylate cyclase/phosphodiesterase n=1 Tax=Rhodococcus sp. BS-15 TaxID=1304954 RepID=UPI001F3D8281|nr:EAL domain-containing protein [Rhodococcus sp. BS-15]